MAFTLTKAEIKDRDDVVEAARRKLGILNAAITQFNERLEEQRSILDDAVNDCNGAMQDVADFLERIKERLNGEYDDKSEKWQEGEKGTAVRDWIDTFEIDFMDIDVEVPNDISEAECDELETLEGVETEPSL